MLVSARTCMDQSIKWAQTRYSSSARWRFRAGAAEDRGAHGRIHLRHRLHPVFHHRHPGPPRQRHHGGDGRMQGLQLRDGAGAVINDAMQIMGGEGYMTETEDRAGLPRRAHLPDRGKAPRVNAVFHLQLWGKQLAESMLASRPH